VVGDLVQASPPQLCDLPLRTIALRPRSCPLRTNPHAWAQFGSDAGRATASVAWPGASAVAECIVPGGDCSKSNLAMAVLPELKGLGLLAKEETAIAGVLKQIESGTTKGKVFENFAGSLPGEAAGYYREYTVPLAGQSGRGTGRLVTGAGGEVYYTADHYATFTRIK